MSGLTGEMGDIGDLGSEVKYLVFFIDLFYSVLYFSRYLYESVFFSNFKRNKKQKRQT